MFKSPIPWIGGKSKSAELILSRIPYCAEYLEPFAGGHVIGLNLAMRGAKVRAYDVDRSLVAFWQAYYNEPEKLFVEANKHSQMTSEKFEIFREEMTASIQLLKNPELGARTFLTQRSSYASMGLGSNFCQNRMRLDKSHMRRIMHPRPRPAEVKVGDYREVLSNDRETFAYLDPPYLMDNADANKCYGNKGENHDGFDHKELFDLIKNRPAWLLSYGDHPSIRKLYEGFKIEEHSVHYTGTSSRIVTELLISQPSQKDENYHLKAN